jgi:hypothetical protein
MIECMTGRQRVKAAMRYQPVDKVPLQYYYAPVGYHEHGEKLNDLFATLPGDFEPFARKPIPVIPPEDYDADGSYHAFRRDEWGTLWEYRIFGIWGMPREYPLKDISLLRDYCFPDPPAHTGPELEALKAQVVEHQRQHYCSLGAGSLIERLKMLRPDEDVLCDIALDTPEINELADRIMEYNAHFVANAIAAGADSIHVGDDYGTERDMLMSPRLWRSFFKPRWKALFQPAVDAGLDVIFHSCGKIMPILEDIREVGATGIWPQLPAYNMQELAGHCRALGLAVAVHTDRANTMTTGTPRQVRDLVEREFEVFRMREGGSWFYVEADNGFPFRNIEALVNAIAQWR